MGPLNNEPVAAKMDEHVADARRPRRRRVVTGGSRQLGLSDRPLTGSRPCSPACPADARVSTEETFGPVAPVVEIELARGGDHARQRVALRPAGGDLHRRPQRAGCEFADRVRTGWVNINESSNYWEAHLPFGGRAGTDSGIGKVGGAHVMHSFTELQTIVITPDRRPR